MKHYYDMGYLGGLMKLGLYELADVELEKIASIDKEARFKILQWLRRLLPGAKARGAVGQRGMRDVETYFRTGKMPKPPGKKGMGEIEASFARGGAPPPARGAAPPPAAPPAAEPAAQAWPWTRKLKWGLGLGGGGLAAYHLLGPGAQQPAAAPQQYYSAYDQPYGGYGY